MPSLPLDVLAIAAHRDDAEQTCGGTLLKMAELGRRTGILDLTRGEMGTRGSAEDREREAIEAARILRVSWREALDIPDGGVENTWENRLKVARVIRETRPQVVILPYWEGRHPDHYTASKLGYEACFLAGLAKLAISQDHVARAPSPAPEEAAFRRIASAVASVVAGEDQSSQEPPGGHGFSRADQGQGEDSALASERNAPHRPFKIIYATLYYDVRPSFVVDITDQFEARLESLMAYRSQFSDQQAGKDIFPTRAEIRVRIEAMARFYGMMAGVIYAEPFLQKEVGLVEDLAAIPVKSI